MCPQGWGQGCALAARGTLCPLWAGCVSGDASALRRILGLGVGGCSNGEGTLASLRAPAPEQEPNKSWCWGSARGSAEFKAPTSALASPRCGGSPPKQGPRWDPPAGGRSSVGASAGPGGLEPCYGGLAVAVGTSAGTSKCLSVCAPGQEPSLRAEAVLRGLLRRLSRDWPGRAGPRPALPAIPCHPLAPL